MARGGPGPMRVPGPVSHPIPFTQFGIDVETLWKTVAEQFSQNQLGSQIYYAIEK